MGLFPFLFASGLTALRAQWCPAFRRPLGVYIILTNRCDSNCRYCTYPPPQPQTLDAEFVCDCIDQFAALGTRKLNLSGGEPLLVDGLDRMIHRAKQRGMFVALTTNGQQLPERLEAVRKADLLMVSLDGDPAIHDRNRGAGSHARVLAAFDGLARARIPFWINTVLHRDNLHAFAYLFAVARHYRTIVNITLIQHQSVPAPLGNVPVTTRVDTLLPDAAEMRGAIRELLAARQRGEPLGTSVAYLEHLLSWADPAQLTSPFPATVPCLAGRLYCHLLFDRRLYACGINVNPAFGQPLQDGVAAAFARLRPHPNCRSCRVACEVENSLIYSLHPGTIVSWLRRLP